ncbi:hypothetical protein JRO89_XS08G0013100 [Xanthoceras sorbifolium]|uniref:Glycosyltransferase n=1 Tax=Xanthoceras sorbifolium TaxID=99658 RepID=A0ABQ8HN26_9ROSI|nr:hypothetical protein JRO89_XS08G0013100 [Xanthoceras sorbifolium]
MPAATKVCHVVFMPYPARGHINPVLILSKLLASEKNDILITIVLTEEWHCTIASEVFPSNIWFATISNDVLPSAKLQAADTSAFFSAVKHMAAPFEHILDQLDPPATTIITDNALAWAVEAGYSRNIPVGLFWVMSVTSFTILHHCDDLFEKGIPKNMEENVGDTIVDFIPGIPSIRVADLPYICPKNDQVFTLMRWVPKFPSSKVKYQLFNTIYELESQVCDAIKEKLEYPVYSVGPLIPYNELDFKSSSNVHKWMKWLLDSKLVAFNSYGWRGEDTCRLQEDCRDLGLVVPWCHQLKVLNHSSVGGFLTHCGWNSIVEITFTGIPVLTFPFVGDQITQSKQVVEDLKIGLRLKKEMGDKTLVTREEIAKTIQTLMNVDSSERKQFVKRAKEVRQICQAAMKKGGSSHTALDAFIQNILQGHAH